MKNTYTHQCGDYLLAVLDICQFFDTTLITRINVPPSFRGQGIGHKLLVQCCEDADREQVTLTLDVASYGDMTNEQLRSWYERHGFEDEGNSMVRRPQ